MIETEDAFFSALERARDKAWAVNQDGMIRHPSYYCPGCAVARLAGIRALPDELRRDIVRATDNVPGHDTRLRSRLLDTLGL